MKQMSLANTGFELVTKRTRKREFLDEMNLVIPWSELVSLIAPLAPAGKTGRPPFATEVMLRIYLLQQFFGHSDPAMEEALHDIPSYQEFAHLDAGMTRLPDESTILRFRNLIEEHGMGQQILVTVNAKLIGRGLMLKTGTVVDATLIAAPSSTKNDTGERDPEMHQTKKGNQWHFGMKAHIGVDADRAWTTTAVNAHGMTQAHALLHGEEDVVFADSGYRGLAKNTCQLQEMFALSNSLMVRKRIWQGLQACSAPTAWAKARKRNAANPKNGQSLASSLVSSYEYSRINSRCGGGYADHTYPKIIIKNKLSHFVKTLFIIQWTICLSIMLSACGGGNDLYFNSSVEADVSDLEETDGLVLQVGNSEKVTIKKSGATTLIGSIPFGNSYTVTIDKQPKDFQWCSLENAAGVASKNRNSIPVNCTSASGQVSTLTKIRTAPPPDEGTLDNVTFNKPHTMVYDSLGNLYVADNDYVIRRITPSGAVTVYAGRVGVGGSDPNKLGAIGIGGLAVDKDDTIYFTEYPNKVRRIRKSDGVIEDYFVVTKEVDNHLGDVSLMGLHFNSAGDLFVNDWYNAVVIKISEAPTGKLKGQIYAGTVGVYNLSTTAIDGEIGIGQFGANMGMDIDKEDNLYVADRGVGYRKIDKNGVISTPVLNTDISFDNMQSIVLDEYKNIYMMGMILTSYVVKITPSGKVRILAGSFRGIGFSDGKGSEAQFNWPQGLVMDPNGHLIVADRDNDVLRKIVPVSP